MSKKITISDTPPAGATEYVVFGKKPKGYYVCTEKGGDWTWVSEDETD